MRCLVTGADGFVGANLAALLVKEGHDVVGACLNRKGDTSLDALGVQIRLEYGDITDYGYVNRLVNAYEAEWIFHLAAVSIVRIANADPYRAVDTNVNGTLNVLTACLNQKQVKAIVVASSDKAYGDHAGACYREDAPLMPTGAYEVSKACADHIARMYATQYGVPAMVVRCANIYGQADLNWSRLVPNSCRLAVQGKAPLIHAAAWEHEREWLHVWDAADAYLTVAEAGKPGEAYNAGSGEVCSAGYVAARVADLAGAPKPEDGAAIGCYEIPAQRLCSDKLGALGWETAIPLDVGLMKTFEWYREYLTCEC